ncbi:MAG: hypothetical protein Q9162_004906 [Coniocarpon cinnabarinum]
MFTLLLSPFFLFFIPALLLFRQRARTLYGSTSKHALQKEVMLPYSPTELTTTDLITIVANVLLKYIPLYGAPQLLSTDSGFELPHIRLYGPMKVDEADTALFRTAAGVEHDQSEATNPFLLVTLTTPLLITILSHPASPIKPLGAVNTRNRFKFHNPHLCSSESDLIKASKKGQLVYVASMGGAGRRKKRGMEFNVSITVSHNNAPVLTQELSFLQFLPKSAKPAYKEEEKDTQEIEGLKSVGLTTTNHMAVPGDGPRAYAACSKDYNPIHVSSLAAKFFGFKSAIAHGNHVTALIVQNAMDSMPGVLRERAEAEKKGQVTSQEPHEQVVSWLVPKGELQQEIVLEVAFVKPVTPLPADVQVTWVEGTKPAGTGQRVEFIANLGGRPCVVGSVE